LTVVDSRFRINLCECGTPKGPFGTKPDSFLKTQIPIRALYWEEPQPGFIEADTVAHCGKSLEGDFVWSLMMTDIVTGWTECREGIEVL
jgi:hypothetical protein